MTSLVQAVRPGILFGERPERRPELAQSGVDRFALAHLRRVRRRHRSLTSFQPILRRIQAEAERIVSLDVASLQERAEQWRQQLRSGALDERLAEQIFAAVFIAIRRTLGVDLHPEQLFAGWAMLHGNVVEMNTGEGKTLTAALPVITVALSGTPVHVITVNEYLVERDAMQLARLYELFGCRVSTVTEHMSDQQRRHAYDADIAYCTNKQIVFDYLRDRQVADSNHPGIKSRIGSLLTPRSARPVMRGLCFAVVDEADSVMIDDARTPLILAEPLKVERAAVTESTVALGIAKLLHEGADFRLQHDNHSVWLTDTGLDAVRRVCQELKGAWRFERYRNELVRQALCAQHLYRRDRHYLVRDSGIELIDEATGRAMPDRKLQHGLHRMLELKEHCTPTDDTTVIAAISFQSFFRRYRQIAGMSGTVREVRGEFREVYGVEVVRIPPHKACRRRSASTRVLRDRCEHLEFAMQRILEHQAVGQPVLVGTRSVELSERLSDLLHRYDIPHSVLNARQNANEARIVAEAGRPGAITVATNMAGRGTDIPLQGSVASLGGLHVINLQVNESSRVDRQLFGRAARQGDPGSCESILALSDELIVSCVSKRILLLADTLLERSPRSGGWFARLLVMYAQLRCERAHRIQRIAVFRERDHLKRQLAISGGDNKT